MDRLVAIVPVEARDKSDGLEVVVHYEGEATRIFAKAPDLHAVARRLLPKDVADGMLAIINGQKVDNIDKLTRSVFRAVADGPPSPKKLEN